MLDRFRKKTPDAHPNQRALGATENALMKLSQRFAGLSRVGEILHLQGPYISLERLNEAVARLQRRHPALRSRLRAHPTNRGCFVLEEDETLRLPVEELARKREERSTFGLQEWRKREKDPINIGDPLIKIWLLQVTNREGVQEKGQQMRVVLGSERQGRRGWLSRDNDHVRAQYL